MHACLYSTTKRDVVQLELRKRCDCYLSIVVGPHGRRQSCACCVIMRLPEIQIVMIYEGINVLQHLTEICE